MIDNKLKIIYRKNPVLYVKNELGEIPSPDQEKVLMEIADLENKFIIISAGRGAGKTMLVSWIVAWSESLLPEVFGGYDVNILGGSSKQSQKMNKYFKSYIKKTELLSSNLLGVPKAFHTEFKHGTVAALKASETSVRADHIDLLVLDEVCSASDTLMESALPQITGARHGRIILLSTPHKYFGVFRKYWDHAERLGFKRYGPWPLTNCHWIDKQQLEFFKNIYSANKYKVEILGKFPDIGHNIWSTKQLEKAVAPEPFEWNKSYDTDMGVDWGQAVPFATVLTSVQYIDGIAYVPAPQFVWEQELYMDTVEWITEHFQKHRGNIVYVDNSHRGENERLEKEGCDIERVVFSTRSKGQMIETISSLLHHRKLVISPDNKLLIQQLQEAVWQVNEKTGMQKIMKQAGNDDCVDSLMVALWQLQDSELEDIGPGEKEEFFGL